jgi:hypothetical protein
MVNTCERLLNVVIDDKPKALRGLDQKVSSQAEEVVGLFSWPSRLPAERADLPHAGIEAEHGKPVVLPTRKASRKVSPWGCGYRRREKANAVL